MKSTAYHILKKTIVCALIVLVAGACSTKKNTFVNRNYHNLTAHYNGYFNGNESLKEGVATLENGHVDNYSRVLDVFRYGSAQQAQGVYPNMDKAIQKGSKVIQKHSMLIRRVEYCNWIDDAYLLIGKANFYKKDYYPAAEIFQYVIQQYKEKDSKFDGMLWMARNNIEMGKYKDAQVVIDLIETYKKFPKSMKGEYHAIIAHMHIKQEKYELAIPELMKAIVHTKKKKVRTRYAFILAQLYEKTKDTDKAIFYYTDVLKKNPRYEMAFNAKLNRAFLTDANSAGGKAVKSELLKMAKDAKNTEYLDRIYYVLANIALKENNETEAITNFNLSIRNSVSNDNQKGMSYLALGDLNFDKGNYENAEAYFDSASTSLSEENPDYASVINKKNSLKDLVANLRIIQKEDSLQKVARMSEKDRDNFIDKIIDKVIRDKEKEKAELEQGSAPIAGNLPPQQQQANTGTGNMWYFYNTASMSFGFADFAKRWGDRKLEDNWRRKNKQTVLGVQGEGADKDSLMAEEVMTDSLLRDKETYLKHLPLTAEKMAQSDEKIIDAFFNLGLIYREQLLNDPKSAESFEELIKRYPKNKFRLTALYHLYRLYLNIGNSQKAEYYKNLILLEFPDSDYAKLISNPNYLKELEARQGKIESTYSEAYEAYLKQDYDGVFILYKKAETQFSKSPVVPQFEMLNTLTIGKTNTLPVFEASLRGIVKKYPTHAVKGEAQAILDYIAKMKGEDVPKSEATGADKQRDEKQGAPKSEGDKPKEGDRPKEEDKPKDGDQPKENTISENSPYKFSLDTVHYYVLVLPKTTNVGTFKTAISDFNGKFFMLNELNINSMMLDPERHLIFVQGLENGVRALNYYSTIKDNSEVFKGLQKDEYSHFPISVVNFVTFYKEKKTEDYLKFFKEKYPLEKK